MKIHKSDMGDILNILPEMGSFENDSTSDFFICTLGFEERTHKILDELLTNPKNHRILILIKYPTNQGDNEKNRLFIEKAKLNLIVYEIAFDRSTFYTQFLDLLKVVGVANSNVIFDISTCSSCIHRSMVTPLSVLW